MNKTVLEVIDMGQARRKLQTVLNARDFPAEILTGVPVVEIKGDAEAVVVCHRGILAYGEDRVQIATSIGPVVIEGAHLEIFRMNRERIVLHGKVLRVSVGGTGIC